MLTLLHPDNVLAAAIRLQGELPVLVGELSSIDIQSTIHDLQATTDPEERQKLSNHIIDQVAMYQPAFVAMKRELKRSQDEQTELEQRTLRLHLQQVLREPLTAFCQHTGISSDVIEPALQTVAQSLILEPLQLDERTVVFKPGVIIGAHSHKLANFRVAPNNLFEVIMGAVAPAIGGGNPWAVAFAMWAVVRFFYKATRLELGEEEATVLWGVIVAPHREGEPSDEAKIISSTNQQRQQVGLPALATKRIHAILNQLKEDRILLQPLDPPNAWQLVEAFVVVSDEHNNWQAVDQVLG